MEISIGYSDIMKALSERKCFVPLDENMINDVLVQAKEHVINEIANHIYSFHAPSTRKVVKSVRKTPEPVKKQVAARQEWKCYSCCNILSSSYQVDHTIPLWDGGADDEKNLTALCANCHSTKTQNEAIERKRRYNNSAKSDNMDDIIMKMKRAKVDKTLFFESFRFTPVNFKL